jgi:hypothetical protein
MSSKRCLGAHSTLLVADVVAEGVVVPAIQMSFSKPVARATSGMERQSPACYYPAIKEIRVLRERASREGDEASLALRSSTHERRRS